MPTSSVTPECTVNSTEVILSIFYFHTLKTKKKFILSVPSTSFFCSSSCSYFHPHIGFLSPLCSDSHCPDLSSSSFPFCLLLLSLFLFSFFFFVLNFQGPTASPEVVNEILSIHSNTTAFLVMKIGLGI